MSKVVLDPAGGLNGLRLHMTIKYGSSAEVEESCVKYCVLYVVTVGQARGGRQRMGKRAG